MKYTLYISWANLVEIDWTLNKLLGEKTRMKFHGCSVDRELSLV